MLTMEPGDTSDAVVYPTSHAQQRLWLAEQIHGNSAAYMLIDAFVLRGPLDLAALAVSIEMLVERHETLRTTFHLLGSHLVQVVHPPPRVDLPLESGDSPGALEDAVRDEVSRAFDLTTGPLLRVRVLRRSPQEHLLVLNMHHLISDGWSLAVFNRELSALYRAQLHGHPSPLDPPRLQYRDFAIWQRRTRIGFDRNHLEFWERHLAGAPQSVTWRTPVEPAPPEGTSGGRIALEIDAGSANRARIAARAAGCTEFMWLLAAYAGAIGRYLAQPDLVLGVPAANRLAPDLADLIGFFVNMLPLRLRDIQTLDRAAILRQARDATLGALAHQQVDFDVLVSHLRLTRVTGRHPVFQTVFAFQNTPNAGWDIDGICVEPTRVDPAAPMYDMTLFLEPRGEAYEGYVEYDGAVVRPAVAEGVRYEFLERATAS
jgi:hypothetical protein